MPPVLITKSTILPGWPIRYTHILILLTQHFFENYNESR